MSACCLSVSLKLSEEFEVIGGTHWSRTDYEGGSTLGEDQRSCVAVGKVWNTQTPTSCRAQPSASNSSLRPGRVRIEASADRHHHLPHSSIRQDTSLAIQQPSL